MHDVLITNCKFVNEAKEHEFRSSIFASVLKAQVEYQNDAPKNEPIFGMQLTFDQ